MTLLPSQLARMKLGVYKGWVPTANIPAKVMLASELPPPAYGRNSQTNRVAGFNMTVGDCVPTGCCNYVQTAMGRQGSFAAIPDSLPIGIYSDVTGYTPQDPSSDRGTLPDQMFAWWKENSIAGYRLKNVGLIHPKDDITYHAAIAKKGAVLAIINLAVEQQNQIEWSAAGEPGTWGAHCVCIDQYDGPAGCTTWGESKWIDRSFFDKGYVVQIYDLDVIED